MKYESYEEHNEVSFGTTGGLKELKRLTAPKLRLCVYARSLSLSLSLSLSQFPLFCWAQVRACSVCVCCTISHNLLSVSSSILRLHLFSRLRSIVIPVCPVLY